MNIENQLDKNEEKLLNKEFYKYVGDDIKLNIIQGVNLKSTDRKKTDFYSEL